MTAVDERPAVTEVTAPGVYDLPEEVYFSDPVPAGSLSFSGAKKLLPPSCPAKFKWDRDNGQAPKATFDFGHAAHRAVLGTGAPLVVVDAPDWRTKAAKDARDEARAAGAIPVLATEAEVVDGMAAALRQHPIASALFDPARGGRPEVSLFRQDTDSDVMLRSRVDWLPASGGSGRMVLPDYKTCVSADRDAISKAMASYAYHQQAAWYSDMVTGLQLAEDVAFVLVFQEKTAPYVVTCVEVHPDAVRLGRLLNREAIDLYRRCVATDTWPGYVDDQDVVVADLPRWTYMQHPEFS